jgi:hypothetical protein
MNDLLATVDSNEAGPLRERTLGRVRFLYTRLFHRKSGGTDDQFTPTHNRLRLARAGSWISGGIEFNWPQHRRPNTFHPVDADIVENGDGSFTLWCHEIDRMVGTRGMRH